MKRDDDYLRQIMLNLENSDETMFDAPLFLSMSLEDSKLQYQAQLSCDAGLMVEINDGVFRMTSQGHDYLDAIRDDGIWRKTKDGAATVGGVTLGMMKEIAIALMKQKLSEKLGISF